MSDNDNVDTGVNVMIVNDKLDKELEGLAAEDEKSKDYLVQIEKQFAAEDIRWDNLHPRVANQWKTAMETEPVRRR